MSDLDAASDVGADSEANPICLDQFLKLCSIAQTGGHAKFMIQHGEVRVNGEIETRRRRKLFANDVVEAGGERFVVPASGSQETPSE